MRYRAVIFDLDGTLLDTLADIADSANTVLASHGLPTYPVVQYRQWVGSGVRWLFEHVLPSEDGGDELIGQCIREFRQLYRHNWNVRTQPYEGVAELLASLAARRVKMAVLSNKPDESVHLCVSEYFPDCGFEMVLGDCDGIPCKPDPAGAMKIMEHIGVPPEQFVYLGDTPVDMKTAAAAGVEAVGALWGFRSLEELRDSGARHFVRHPMELLDIVVAGFPDQAEGRPC